MANPGPYQMGQPMGAPNMGGPPMGQMGMMPRPPMRQGTSKMVPVVVSAGLAVGVFCGLLFGLGTGSHSVAAPEKASNNAKRDEVQVFQPESLANPNVKVPDKNAPKAGSNAGSGAVAQAGAGSGSAAEPTVKPTKLVVEIKPEAAAQAAKVLVDDKPIEGLSTEIPLEAGASKKVKVTVKATGYKDIEQEVDVEGESVTVKLDLIKGRSAPTGTAGTHGTGAGGGATATTGSTGGTAQTPTSGGTGGGATTSGGGGGGGGKASGGTKSNSNSGKSGKSGKGSGGLIDI
jgi:hypothetical protein